MAVVNDDPCGRRRRHGELARPASMVGGSSSNSVLEEEATTASLFLGLDGDESGSAVAGHGEQSQWVEAEARAELRHKRARVRWVKQHFSSSRC
jgi:hypothetical protein